MSDQVTLYQTPRTQWLRASAAAVYRHDRVRADIWRWYAEQLDRRPGMGQIGPLSYGVATEADRLEALLSAAGYDPDAQECWFFWDFWQQRGLAATLQLLQTAGRSPGAAGYIDQASASQHSPQRRDGV